MAMSSVPNGNGRTKVEPVDENADKIANGLEDNKNRARVENGNVESNDSIKNEALEGNGDTCNGNYFDRSMDDIKNNPDQTQLEKAKKQLEF